MPQGTAVFHHGIGDGEVGERTLYLARAKYKFSDDGGAISSIALFRDVVIPAGAIIVEGGLDVIVSPTSGGAATLGLTLESAGDLIAAAAISGAPWSTLGRKNLIPQTWATSVKTTAARDVLAVVGAFALTAGEFDVYLKYVLPV